MRLTAAVAIAFLLSGAARADESHDGLLSQAQEDPKAAFTAYARMHDREYLQDEQEFNRRYEIFMRNVRRIVEHNARIDVSYTLGLNGFADLTTEEFGERYFGPSPMDLMTLRSSQGKLQNELNHPFPHSHDIPPVSVNWVEAGIVTPIKDQHVNGSKCGCCYAFGGLAGVEAANAKYTGKLTTLSEQQIVDCDSLDFGCEGGDFTNVVQYVHENGGIDSDIDYPYLAREDKCEMKKAGKHHVVTVDGYQAVPHANETALMQAVAHMPTIVAVCCGIYLDQWHLYKGGIFDVNAHCTEPLDHAVLVVGYGAEEDGTQYWLIKNSWGSHWGEEGYIKLLRNVSDPLGQNGLVSLPPAYVLKEHPNPDADTQGRRGGRMSGGLLALSDYLSGWFDRIMQN